ncbi:MAG: hypothetical protein M1840_008432 [Geoglossum simile]|nr:MAG: hypothetical protein M1840_008432 [Geoglossum simile]
MGEPLAAIGFAITARNISLQLATQDAEWMLNNVKAQNTNNWLLKRILFDPSPIYGGHTLFEQFPEDVREEVKLDFMETENAVGECVKILGKRYGYTLNRDSANGCTTPDSTTSTASVSRVRQSMLLGRWSLWDKRRVELVVRRYVNLNERVHNKIKLCSFAGTLGMNLRHLQRLAEDDDSKMLGFNNDAALRLIKSEADPGRTPLKALDKWHNEVEVEGNFATAEWHGKSVLLEHRPYVPSYNIPDSDMLGPDGVHTKVLDKRTAKIVDRLARLLEQPKEQVFRIPRCHGWTYLPECERIFFIFEIAGKAEQSPISLLGILKKDLRLSLNDKFRLALALATCLSQLHMVNWVHESFRSENVLFWAASHIGSEPEDLEAQLDFGQPWVLGFECSRPDIHRSVPGTAGPDPNPERDVYRHPERQGTPEVHFTKSHDIYALGVVLLEIALWEPAKSIAGPYLGAAKTNPGKLQEWFLKQAKRRVKQRVGEKYRDLVVKCLSGNFGVDDDTKGDLNLQQAFRRQVLDVLEQALKSV